MITYPPTILRLIAYFSKLPGVGRRSAERLATAVLSWSDADLAAFSGLLGGLKAAIRPCRICGNLAEGEFCALCSDDTRRRDVLCVVEHASQIIVIENSGSFRGLYHVLGGRIAPLSGKGPEHLRIPGLLERVRAGGIREVILATSPDVEGEATAHYLAAELQDTGVAVTRIASGVPVGADLNYADAATLSMAFSGRRRMDG